MHTIRIILFLAIIIGSGWFFYHTYSNPVAEYSENTLGQNSYKKTLPFFTTEEIIEHKTTPERVIKIQTPTLFIEGNATAAEKINTYIHRMIEDERVQFLERNAIDTSTTSSPLLLHTLSIEFEELYTHPQFISIALHVSKSFSRGVTREARYAMFDAVHGTQLPVQKLFSLTQDLEVAQILCLHMRTEENTPTQDECIRTIQDPDAIGLDAHHMRIALKSSSSTGSISIPTEDIRESFHPNIQLALKEHQESLRMGTPE